MLKLRQKGGEDMAITDLISITELARLTNKSRPTIYKYINDYSRDRFDEIPYSFVVLLEKVEYGNMSKFDIVDYCRKTYAMPANDEELTELISLITKNRDMIDLNQIKEYIEGAIKDDRNHK